MIRLVLLVVALGAGIYVGAQCLLAASRSTDAPATMAGYLAFAVLFALLGLAGAYYIVVHSRKTP